MMKNKENMIINAQKKIKLKLKTIRQKNEKKGETEDEQSKGRRIYQGREDPDICLICNSHQ